MNVSAAAVKNCSACGMRHAAHAARIDGQVAAKAIVSPPSRGGKVNAVPPRTRNRHDRRVSIQSGENGGDQSKQDLSDRGGGFTRRSRIALG
jgi:uncharacterized protein involved in copper resistance